jgi:hypothetical protein
MTGPRSPSRGRVIVFGIMFWYPLAGVTYQFLHYLIGLRRLGYDPWYVEDSGRWIYDPVLNDISPDASRNVAMVAPALEAHGFADRWAFRGRYPGGRCYGLEEERLDRLYREADAMLNVTAAQELRDEHMACPLRVYVESDPFRAQVLADSGDEQTRAFLAGHHVHFSFGENIGAPDCTVPTVGIRWRPTRQPVVLDLWAAPPPPGPPRFTTITTWHNKGKDVPYRGDTYYWTKDREFERFLDLPRRRATAFELAIGRDEVATRAMLEERGWRTADSGAVSADAGAYRRYIQSSSAEFTVARDQYVRPRTGWFSDRSACYLAAGRPVVTEETGFSKVLPTGKGLFGFSTVEEADEAVGAVEADYEAHARAARDVAAEHFAAEKVLGRLLEQAGL